MNTAREIVEHTYAAFARGDVPAMLEFVAEPVDWECVITPDVPYGGRRTSRREVGAFFAQVAEADDIEVFEPREFFEAGDTVTVLGYERTRVRPTGKLFESEWAHIFTVRGGRIVRWRGFFNTAARQA